MNCQKTQNEPAIGISRLPPSPKSKRVSNHNTVRREMERIALANRQKPLDVEWLERNRRLFAADPSNPYAMSWLDEPNAEEYFGYNGLECVLLRNANGCWEGCLCIPQYFWIARESFHHLIPTLRVHGGITRVLQEETFLVVGFDTSHLESARLASWFSTSPTKCSSVSTFVTESRVDDDRRRRPELDFYPVSMRYGVLPARCERYRTLSYCREQLEGLADQVLRYGAVSRSARLLQSHDWIWSCGGPIFPGASVDSRGRLVLDLLGDIGTADVLGLVRDFLRGRQLSKRSSHSEQDLKLADALEDLLFEYARDDEGDFPKDFGPCLKNLPDFARVQTPAVDLSSSKLDLHDSVDRMWETEPATKLSNSAESSFSSSSPHLLQLEDAKASKEPDEEL